MIEAANTSDGDDAFVVSKRCVQAHVPTDAISSWKRLAQLHIENYENVLPPSQQESRQANFGQFGSYFCLFCSFRKKLRFPPRPSPPASSVLANLIFTVGRRLRLMWGRLGIAGKPGIWLSETACDYIMIPFPSARNSLR